MFEHIILIHGIGDHQPGWSEADEVAKILKVPLDRITEVTYEDLLEKDKLNWFLKWAAKLAATYYAAPVGGNVINHIQDYLNDIAVYFLRKKTRKAIHNRLKEVIKEHPGALIVGHSLGSIVAYETLIQMNEWETGNPYFVTLGSPLGRNIVRWQLDVEEELWIPARFWLNIKNRVDPIASTIVNDGCDLNHKFSSVNGGKPHDFMRYVLEMSDLLIDKGEFF